jgi:hypothetical protein
MMVMVRQLARWIDLELKESNLVISLSAVKPFESVSCFLAEFI